MNQRAVIIGCIGQGYGIYAWRKFKNESSIIENNSLPEECISTLPSTTNHWIIPLYPQFNSHFAD